MCVEEGRQRGAVPAGAGAGLQPGPPGRIPTQAGQAGPVGLRASRFVLKAVQGTACAGGGGQGRGVAEVETCRRSRGDARAGGLARGKSK